MVSKCLFSSNSDEWSTPIELFNYLNNIYHFNLDVCASKSNFKCNNFFDIETNGLDRSWLNHICFCNPPYSNISKWVEKCYNESLFGTKIVLLIPSRTDTKYFHNYIYNKPNITFTFIKGRLHFGDSKNSAPFPSMLVFYNLKEVFYEK